MNTSHAPFESEEHYSLLRLKLVLFFERRRCHPAEDPADDCISRLLKVTNRPGARDEIDKLAFGIAKNVYLEWVRRSAKYSASPVKDQVDRSTLPSDASRIAAQEAVAMLDPTDRELMERYYLDECTSDRLAVETGLSAKGLRSRIFRKKRLLLKIFQARMSKPIGPSET